MPERFARLFDDLPYLLGGHLMLSLCCVLIGVLVSVPFGALATRHPRLQGPVLTIAGLIQTIPGLALLALMVPLLGGMIGFLPAFLALTLYSILPMLRNTVTGIKDVDPSITEAARGMGMTDKQILFGVELPLAAPVIIAGIRTATVWVVGMATLATPVGAPSLGQYIFFGLQTRNWDAVVFGCVFSALLAVILDQLIRTLEVSARTRNKKMGVAALSVLVAIAVFGIAPFVAESLGTREAGRAGSVDPATGKAAGLEHARTIKVGSKGFTEQYVLSDFLQAELQARGADVAARPNMGSTILFDALSSGEIDMCVDYTGTIWSAIMKRETMTGRWEMLFEIAAYLKNEYGIVTVGPMGFENAYCLAMRKDKAAELGISSIADLATKGANLTIGGDPEVFGRQEWDQVKDAYGLQGVRTRGMDSTFMYDAARDGQVDVITAYSTDGRIAAYDLVVLKDPKQGFPPYDAILLVSPEAAAIPGLLEALRPLVRSISDEAMREANRLVDLEGKTPAEAAASLRK
jgi:osmoprotectant transport system permease protein